MQCRPFLMWKVLELFGLSSPRSRLACPNPPQAEILQDDWYTYVDTHDLWHITGGISSLQNPKCLVRKNKHLSNTSTQKFLNGCGHQDSLKFQPLFMQREACAALHTFSAMSFGVSGFRQILWIDFLAEGGASRHLKWKVLQEDRDLGGGFIPINSKSLINKLWCNPYKLSRWWFQMFFFLFSPRSLGKWSTLTISYFSDGWFNHQLTDH